MVDEKSLNSQIEFYFEWNMSLFSYTIICIAQLVDLYFIYFYAFENPFAGHAIIHILPEIPCKDLQAKDVANLTENTQQLMQHEFERLSAETKKYKWSEMERNWIGSNIWWLKNVHDVLNLNRKKNKRLVLLFLS